MKRLAMVGMLALLSRVLLAQAPSEVRGRVLDAESGDPLSGADVSIGGFLVTTGRDGTFLFGSLDAGRYELRVRRVGYAPNMRGIEVLPGQSQQDRNPSGGAAGRVGHHHRHGRESCRSHRQR